MDIAAAEDYAISREYEDDEAESSADARDLADGTYDLADDPETPVDQLRESRCVRVRQRHWERSEETRRSTIPY